MNILVACEESQAVCVECRKLGHNAFSCDIEPCSGGHPEWHIQQDVIPLLNGNCEFTTVDGTHHKIDGKWDMIVAHPPCTYLSVAGNKYFNIEKYGEKAIKRMDQREDAVKFFMEFVNADCDRIAIENPIGIMITRYRKPDQIIQPWQFGCNASKATCLWLKGIYKLLPTNIMPIEARNGNQLVVDGKLKGFMTRDETGKLLSFSDKKTAKIRSKTFPNIAKAIAHQWCGRC